MLFYGYLLAWQLIAAVNLLCVAVAKSKLRRPNSIAEAAGDDEE